MRSIRIILQTLTATLLALYVAVAFALENSRVQEFLAQKISEQMEEAMGTRVKIGSVSIGLFNAIELHDITIYDQRQEALLTSGLIYGKFRVPSLLRGHIFLHNISVLDGNIHLYRQEEKEDANYQFLLNLFKTNKKRKSLHLTINSLLLRRCTMTYDDRFYPKGIGSQFSPHHIRMNDIDANLSLKELTEDSLNVRVRQMSFREQSGFRLDKLRLHLLADRRHFSINDLVLALPSSHIRQKHIEGDFNLKDKETLRRTFALKADLQDIVLATKDIAPLLPIVAQLDETIRCRTTATVQGENIRLDGVEVSSNHHSFTFKSNVQINLHPGCVTAKLQNIDCKMLQGWIDKNYRALSAKALPPALAAVGNVEVHGDAEAWVPRLQLSPDSKVSSDVQRSYILNNATASFDGAVTSGIGHITTAVNYNHGKVQLALSSANANPSKLYAHKYMPTLVDFSAKMECELANSPAKHDGNKIKVQRLETDAEVKSVIIDDIRLHNMTASAQCDLHKIAVALSVKDPALNIDADMQAGTDAGHAWSQLPTDFAVSMDAKCIQPNKLRLTHRYGDGKFAFRLKADANGLSRDNLHANLYLTDLTLSDDNLHVVPYHLKRLVAQAEPQSHGSHIRLRSDFADLDYSGSIVPDSLRSLLYNVSRSIKDGVYRDDFSSGMGSKNQQNAGTPAGADRYSLALNVKDAEFFNRMLNINAKQGGPVQIQMSALQDGSHVTVSALASELAFGKFALSNLSLFAQSNDGAFNMLGKVSKKLKNEEVQAELTAINKNGSIITDIEWDETKSHAFYGKISTASQILLPSSYSNPRDANGHITVNTEFFPSVISLGDSLWNVANGTIHYDGQKITINRVGISHADQHLSINGTYNRTANDTIVVELNKIDLDYALAFAHLNVVDFGGHATGNIYVRQLPNGNPWAKAEIKVPDFTFNHADFGMADVQLDWDHENYDINIQGYMEEPNVGYTRVIGYVDPINRDLDLHTESQNTQLAFLNKYTAGIFERISGRATGNCRIYGPFKGIEFSGKEVASCQATIPVTGVTYKVTEATVDVTREAFVFSNATIRDNFTGVGNVEGVLRHKHLQDMTYDFRLNGKDLRMYEKPRELDMPFFATATGSGNVHITGVPGKMNADIRISTTPGSELTYILDSPDADVSQLLSFRDAAVPAISESAVAEADATTVTEVPETEFNLYFEVDVEDQSRLNLITDDKSGDVITVYGDGPIQAIYHNRSGFQMFGTYNIQRGTYGLNIPSLAQRKKFDILSGGRVQFSGDPTEAEVNVHAQYVVNSASLADLNIGTGFANNTTRVNCVVDIFGEVANMQFNLDFELPNCSEDEQQMVRQLIASEEDRTRQVLYLLGVGRFYAYNYTSNELGQSQSVLMMNSLLSTTLSSQLNNIISNAVGNNNWSFGTNISTGQLGWNDMEVEGLVSSRLLNNRLLINGNFGYSERQAATTNFVGDFDVQYLITPKGNISVRAYSETNDRYFTKSTLTTQGVGIQLKRDFAHFISLFRKNKTKNTRKK